MRTVAALVIVMALVPGMASAQVNIRTAAKSVVVEAPKPVSKAHKVKMGLVYVGSVGIAGMIMLNIVQALKRM